MITIKSKKVSVQAEGVFENIKLLGNVETDGQGITYIAGSAFVINDDGGERYIGNFNSNANLQITISDKKDSSLLVLIADAVKAFQDNLQIEIEKNALS